MFDHPAEHLIDKGKILSLLLYITTTTGFEKAWPSKYGPDYHHHHRGADKEKEQ